MNNLLISKMLLIKKLGNNEIIYKRCNEKGVGQEKTKPLGVEVRRQCVAENKKYSVKITLKEVGPKML